MLHDCHGCVAVIQFGCRFVFLGVFLIGLLVSASYSAALTSFLAVKIHKPPFRNMKEMLYDTNYNIVTVAGTNYVEIFSVRGA